MSWAGGMYDYPVTMDKEEIMSCVNDDLYQARGSMEPVFQPFVWKESICLDSYEEAEAWLQDPANMQRYWREKNVAIQFISRTRATTKKEEELEKRVVEITNKMNDYIRDNHISNRKSAYVGCPTCGSKLSLAHMSGDHCPLCRTDLRSQTVLDTIERYKERIRAAKKAVSDEKKRPKKGDKVEKMWLINAEAYIG